MIDLAMNMPSHFTGAMHMPLLAPSAHQRGSVAVLTAAFISLAIILAASIDIGFLFFQKRELQKVVDMAAIAGAQELSKTGTCASPISFAISNAQQAQQFPGQPDVSCGRWDPAEATHYSAYADGIVPSGQAEPNAIRVRATRAYRSFFGAWAEQSVNAQAVAAIGSPNAVFSVGSNLLTIDGNGTLSGFVSQLTGLNSAALVGYSGLASANIQTSALLNALGIQVPLDADVGTIKQAVLLNTANGCSNGSCPLEAVLGATSSLGGQQGLVDALGLQVGQLSQQIKLLSDDDGRGLINLDQMAADGQSALKSQLNALDLVTTAIGVANSHHLASVPLTVSDPASLAKGSINASIIEPPSIGMGGIGAIASTAQVRLSTSIKVGSIQVLNQQIDAINGWGTIADLCDPGKRDADGNLTVDIDVYAKPLSLCAPTASETDSACATPPATPIGTVRLSMAQPDQSVSLELGDATDDLVQAALQQMLAQGQGDTTSSTLAGGLLAASGNSLNTAVSTLNSSLASLVNFLNGLGQGGSSLAAVGSLVSSLSSSVASLLSNLTGNVLCNLSPKGYNQCMLENQLNGNQTSGTTTISNVMLSLLALVEPVLHQLGTQLNTLLGMDLNRIDVKLIDLNCGGRDRVRLVY